MSTTSEYGRSVGARSRLLVDRFPPAVDLGALVERHWLVSWSCRPPGGLGDAAAPPVRQPGAGSGALAVAGVGGSVQLPLSGRGRVFVVSSGRGLPAVPRPTAVGDHRDGAARSGCGDRRRRPSPRWMAVARGSTSWWRSPRASCASAGRSRPAGRAGRTDRGRDAARPVHHRSTTSPSVSTSARAPCSGCSSGTSG